MSRLIEKLWQMMPLKPEKPHYGMMLMIDQQPIRQAADSFAHAMEPDLPSNQDELAALLWVFGEMLCGEMERREQVQARLIADLCSVSVNPIMFDSVEGKIDKRLVK